MRRGLSFAVLGPCAALALAACTEPQVVRLVDGRPEAGRFISEAAYAAYARAALAEATGDLETARRAYAWASLEDPDSPEIWTRIGAVECRVSGSPAQALEAFERARGADASYGPLYRERARCLLAKGSTDRALDDAERALTLDPDDLDTAIVRADALARAGKSEDARRALVALTVRRPAAREPWRALLLMAQRQGDARLAREAEEHLAVSPSDPVGNGRAMESASAAIDEALRRGDLRDARRHALEGRVPAAEVAVRAAALGLARLAREQADRVVAADPTDTSARIALVAAADLAGDLPALADAMRTIPHDALAPSPLARWLLADVLQRRVGSDAARAWLGGPAAHEPVDDPLLASTEERVRAALAAGPR